MWLHGYARQYASPRRVYARGDPLDALAYVLHTSKAVRGKASQTRGNSLSWSLATHAVVMSAISVRQKCLKIVQLSNSTFSTKIAGPKRGRLESKVHAVLYAMRLIFSLGSGICALHIPAYSTKRVLTSNSRNNGPTFNSQAGKFTTGLLPELQGKQGYCGFKPSTLARMNS